MAAKGADSVEAVQGTAGDALRCKRSLIKQGYLPEFSNNGETARAQSPLANRFYHARVRVLLQLVENAVSTRQVAQVAVIGAGLDTLVEQAVQRISPSLPVYALDYATVLSHRPITSTAIPIPCDLGQLDDLERGLLTHGFRFSDKTLIVIECVLMYMEAAAVDELMRWLTTRLRRATMVSFEPVGFICGFGKVLASKFATAVTAVTSSSQAHSESIAEVSLRLRLSGWKHLQVLSAMDAVRLYLRMEEMQRVSRLEPFDEYAALFALLQCYAVSVASTDADTFVAVANQHAPASDTTELEQQHSIRLAILRSRIARLEVAFSTSVRHTFVRELSEIDDTELLRVLFQKTHEPHMHIASVAKYVRHVLRDDLKDPLRYYNRANGRRMLLAFDAGRVVGMVAIAAASEVVERGGEEEPSSAGFEVTVELKRLCVDESHRGKGIGRRLLAAALNQCRQHRPAGGKVRVMATTLELLKRAQALYESDGFVQVKREAIDALGECVLLTYSREL